MIKMKKINKRSFKYGSYAIAVSTIVIAIIIVFNALLGLDVVRDRLRFDITKEQMFSLSEPSIDLLKNLDKDVEVIILTDEKYYKGNIILESIVDILKQYNLKSNGKVTTSFLDVDKNPTYISKELDPEQTKGIKEDSIVVKSGTKIKVVSQNDMVEYDYQYYGSYPAALKIEQIFSSAIKSVISDFTPVIYFATGHGEISTDTELSELKSTITANNYEVKEISLANPVPEDAAIIFFASPKTDLLAKELENLLAFMEKGGDAVFLMDVQSTSEELPNFDMVFERYSLALNNDIVLEGDQNWYMNEFTIIIPQPNENDVTMNLDPRSLFLYMPNCRSVEIELADKQWVNTQPLFMTSNKSQSTNLVTGETIGGPFLLGALSEYRGEDTSKIALIGNAAFITDNWMQNTSYNGVRYILSTLNWMQDKADSIFIPSKSLASEPIKMTESTRFIAFIILSFILPLVIIGLGVFVWIRRKHL